MLQDSIKEQEPMKVGRFGLGFKSVLHMTGNKFLQFIIWIGFRSLFLMKCLTYQKTLPGRSYFVEMSSDAVGLLLECHGKH